MKLRHALLFMTLLGHMNVGAAPQGTLPPYRRMDYGPALFWTLQVAPGNIAQKGLAIRLDDGPGGVSKGRAWMVYDHNTMRVAAATSGEFVDWKGIAFDGSHGAHTSLSGERHFVNLVGPGWASPEGKWDDARVVDDFVNLMDLAPTCMEFGGVKIPDGVSGRSLVPQLTSTKSGQIDPIRDYIVTGRERHVGAAREGNLPYPMRAIHTKNFVFVRNFAPDRWPMGAPYAVTEISEPSASELETNTRAAFPDMDASPTKAWLVAHRNEGQGKPFYDRAFAKRAGEELYDLRSDPGQTTNVAAAPKRQPAK